MPEHEATDVLVIGSGGAGLRAAIEAHDQGTSTMLVSNGAVGKSGATMIAGADITLDGAGAAKIGLPGNESDSKESFFHDIVIQGYYLNNQRLVEAYVRDAPARTKEMIDWGVRYRWDGERAIHTPGTDINRVLVEQVKKRSITLKEDLYITDLLTQGKSTVGVFGLDINSGKLHAIKAKAVIIATGGWQRAYSFTSAPGGLAGVMHAAAYRAGADLQNMEMVTFCPNVILWPPALRGDIFPYILIGMFGDLLEKHARPFLRDEYDPLIYRIATSTEWNKLIFSMACTKIVLRGDGSPRGGTYYSIKNVPVNILEEGEKIHPGWTWLRTDYSNLMNWLKEGNAVEVAPAAHYMEGGITVNEHAATTLRALYAAGECTGGLFGANRVASAITQILVQGAIAGKSAADYSKKTQLQELDKTQLKRIEARLTKPLNQKEGIRAIDLRKRIRNTADENLWVIRNEKGLKKTIAELETIISNDLPRISIQTQTRSYNKEWIEALECESLAQVLLASARSALMRTESRGVHNRSDYPQTDNGRWLREVIVRQVKGKMRLSTRPIKITRFKPPRVKFGFEEGIIRAVKALGE
ncbi:MAG TPA: FAD-binding protein [Candidatus Bathyarchaeia archaeon]|nr:FAD-binding protein [Candidatus Bathyarchaeia archaeon]